MRARPSVLVFSIPGLVLNELAPGVHDLVQLGLAGLGGDVLRQGEQGIFYRAQASMDRIAELQGAVHVHCLKGNGIGDTAQGRRGVVGTE